MATFYSMLFETFICQFNRYKFSPIMPDEIREQEIRDHSFIQNHSRSFIFTSSLQFTQFLQASGQRTGMTSRSLALCSVTHFCVVFEVCVWIIVRLEDENMAYYKISNRVSQV